MKTQKHAVKCCQDHAKPTGSYIILTVTTYNLQQWRIEEGEKGFGE